MQASAKTIAFAAAMLLGAASAWAENTSTLQSGKLDADFTLCPEDSNTCSLEAWHIAIHAKGWKMVARTRFDLRVEDWTESCTDGRYQSDAGGHAWGGTCALTGEPGALCFTVEMSSEDADTTTSSRQCFQLLAPHICIMQFESSSGPLGAPPDDPERIPIALGAVNACIVSEAR